MAVAHYWGVTDIGFFAPRCANSPEGTLGEFKTMVKTLHAAGIEVILDVVYNHTAEGDHTGLTLSFRGIDNAIYYRLDPAHPRRYLNTTGTGNSFNAAHRVPLALIMDSLRYWVEEMHVDGFRFDLATRCAAQYAGRLRPQRRVSRRGAQDLVVSRVKLIAEPWTSARAATSSGISRRAGRSGTTSTARPRAPTGAATRATIGELASRIAGSKDIFGKSARAPPPRASFLSPRTMRLQWALREEEKEPGQPRRQRRPRRQP